MKDCSRRGSVKVQPRLRLLVDFVRWYSSQLRNSGVGVLLKLVPARRVEDRAWGCEAYELRTETAMLILRINNFSLLKVYVVCVGKSCSKPSDILRHFKWTS